MKPTLKHAPQYRLARSRVPLAIFEDDKITTEALRIFSLLHGSGDAGSEAEYHAQNPSLINGFERLAVESLTRRQILREIKLTALTSMPNSVSKDFHHIIRLTIDAGIHEKLRADNSGLEPDMP